MVHDYKKKEAIDNLHMHLFKGSTIYFVPRHFSKSYRTKHMSVYAMPQRNAEYLEPICITSWVEAALPRICLRSEHDGWFCLKVRDIHIDQIVEHLQRELFGEPGGEPWLKAKWL